MGSPSGAVGISGLTTASTQVIAADTARKSMKFFNPNTVSQVPIAVCPAFDKDGNALTAGWGTDGANAGNFIVEPDAELSLEGNIQTAWLAAAKSGTTSTLTIWVRTS